MRRHLLSLSAIAIAATLGVACTPADRTERSEGERTERWPATETTEKSNVAMDWDKVNEAYRFADGPQDLERRVNEIYEGSEIISISVADVDAKTQLVTGFFDKNANGVVDDAEKVFTIRRDLDGEQANVQTTGYGPYAGHYSPMLSIASGMLMGSMMSRMFMPGYMPMYQQPYTTPGHRVTEMRQTRSTYRAANPSQFQKSQTGRTYGGRSTAPARTPMGSRGFGGGGKFGVASKRGAKRLTA